MSAITEYQRRRPERSSLEGAVCLRPEADWKTKSIRILICAALISLYYFSMITDIGRKIFASSLHGMIFNSMALHLLDGKFDVSPDAVGDEAFIRNGKTYAYFGIIPAL